MTRRQFPLTGSNGFVSGPAKETLELKMQLGSEQGFTDLAQILRREFSGDRKAWTAVADLFKRRYWSRVWIVQEVALSPATSIRCGAIDQTNWHTIKRLHDILSTWQDATASSAVFNSPSLKSALTLFDEAW